MCKKLNLIKHTFERLTVLESMGSDKHRKQIYKCQCKCGKIVIVGASDLLRGNNKSCGCLRLENITRLNATHMKSKTLLHQVWLAMKGRCFNKNNKAYKNYGGRGIIVCNEWKNDFQIFYDWAVENGYSEGLTIERKNNDKNYEPYNCKWATRKEQNSNTRRTHFIEYNGISMTMTEWAKYLEIKYHTLANRILTYKWSIKKAFETPVRSNTKQKLN